MFTRNTSTDSPRGSSLGGLIALSLKESSSGDSKSKRGIRRSSRSTVASSLVMYGSSQKLLSSAEFSMYLFKKSYYYCFAVWYCPPAEGLFSIIFCPPFIALKHKVKQCKLRIFKRINTNFFGRLTWLFLRHSYLTLTIPSRM